MKPVYYGIYDLGSVLTDQETCDLSRSIKENKNLWTHESFYWGSKHKGKPIHFLGSPVYPAKFLPSAYRKLREKSNQFLIENTASLLQKILKTIGEMHNCSIIEHLDNSSLPGFHVFHSNTPCIEEYNYHTDNDYIEFQSELGLAVPYSLSNFYSFTVAIELPNAGGTVDFKLEDDMLFSLPYKVGHAYMWKADIPHKIGNVILDSTDYRITFQGHFIRQPNKILYYW
jgi:hypothetical protein